MILLMTVAAVVCVLQLGLLGSWGRSLRISTLLLTIAVGFFVCGTTAVLLQLAWTRTLAAVTGGSLSDIVLTASYTMDPVIEEVVKLLPLAVVAWRWSRAHRQLGFTDHLLAGAALGVGFELFEAALRFSTLGALTTAVPGGYLVAASLGGTVTVPAIWTSLTSWQPAPAAFEELLSFTSGGDTVQHLVWTALAAVGLGWFVRRADPWRWLGVLPLVVACLDHANYNYRIGTVAAPLTVPSDLVAWIGGRLPGLLVVALVAAVAYDRWVQARIRPQHPSILLTGESPTGLGPGPLLRRATAGPPWSTYVTWRFVLARRAAVLAEAVQLPPPSLLDLVAVERDRLERATSGAAWADAGRRLRPSPDLSLLWSWRTVLWVVAVVPAFAYLVLGGLPATRGLQAAMRGTVGLWLLVAGAVAGSVLVIAQLRPLLAVARSAPEPGVHESRLRPQVRLVTAAGSLLAGGLLVVAALVARDPDQRIVTNFHALDALGDALLILGIALFVASFIMFPPLGLAVATTGELILVSTVSSAFITAVAGSAVLAGTGVMLSEAADGSGGSSKGGSGADDAATAARQRRLDELSRDPAHGGRITPGSRAEAEVGLGLEERGAVHGLRRSPHPGEEFRDAANQAWDVKAFRSRGFDVASAVRKIRMEMLAGKENVMLDLRQLTSADQSALRQAVEQATARGELPLRVLWWP